MVFSVEKLPLSQLVMFDIEGKPKKREESIENVPFFLIFKLVFFFFHSSCCSCYSSLKLDFRQGKNYRKKGEGIEAEKMGFVQLEEDKNQETLLHLWWGEESSAAGRIQ